MNIITVAGNIGKDAEIRATPTGESVASFSVADSQGKDKPTIWWRCNLWGKRAESLAQYLTKGSKVTVTGQVTEREYQDKDGQQRKSMEVRVIDVALQGGAEQEQKPAQRPSQDAAKARQLPSKGSGFDDMDDSIPF
jgi:single-strand DNA-binding protein